MQIRKLVLSSKIYILDANIVLIKNDNCHYSELNKNRVCISYGNSYLDVENKKFYEIDSINTDGVKPLSFYYYHSGIIKPSLKKDVRDVHKLVRKLIKEKTFEFFDISEVLSRIYKLDAVIPTFCSDKRETANISEDRLCIKKDNKFIDLENDLEYVNTPRLGVARVYLNTYKSLSNYFYECGIKKQDSGEVNLIYQKIRLLQKKKKFNCKSKNRLFNTDSNCI